MLEGERSPGLRVGEGEAESEDQRPGVRVVRVMAGGERGRAQVIEGIAHDGAGGLFAEALAPEAASDMNAELEDVRFVMEGTETGATGEGTAATIKDRPVLNADGSLTMDLDTEAISRGLGGEWTAEIAGDVGVAPERHGETKVGIGPMAEVEAFRSEKRHAVRVAGVPGKVKG